MSVSATELARIEAVRRFRILDSEREGTFDRITGLASSILGVPRACVSLVDSDRSWFKSVVGFEANEIPRAPGLCESTILGRGIFHIRDARCDPVAQFNALVQAPDGVRFYAGVPLRTADGFVIGTLCAFGPEPRDLSEHERVWLEKLGEFTMHEIESRRMRLELKDTEGALRQAQRLGSIGLVASGVAHDFNNLLSGIIGNIKLLKREVEGRPIACELVDEIELVARRSSELVGHVLAHAGSEEVEVRVPIDLNALVCETQYMLESVVHENTSLELFLASDPAVVDVNPASVRQLIMNLITNASEAYEGREGTVRLSTARAGEEVLLTVSDHGGGLSPEAQEHMFEPLFTTKATGRGLGLAVIKRIVDSLEAEIEYESDPGEGTRFSVRFPLSQALDQSHSTISSPVPVSATGETILLIDDEPAILRVARRILISRGYQVLSAPDGEQGIALLEEHKGQVAAVLLDMSMPKMIGEHTLIGLRQVVPHLKVVLSSGHTEEQARQKFGDHKVDAFLKKPYGLDELLEITSSVLHA